MSLATERAALVLGVTATADPTGYAGVLYRGGAATTFVPLLVPAGVRGRWINLFASRTAIQYAFGVTSAPALTWDQDTSVGTGLATAGATVPAGVVAPVIVPSNACFLSVVSESATGKVEVYCAESLSVPSLPANLVVDDSQNLLVDGSGNWVVP